MARKARTISPASTNLAAALASGGRLSTAIRMARYVEPHTT
jgi:hypothetical protein